MSSRGINLQLDLMYYTHGVGCIWNAAENAAMEKNVHPGDWTYQNIADMRAQLKPMGYQ
jgi:hypothetical protein